MTFVSLRIVEYDLRREGLEQRLIESDIAANLNSPSPHYLTLYTLCWIKQIKDLFTW